MRVGFTGSKQGVTSAQLHSLRGWLLANTVDEFHHGCCVGADTYANAIAYEYGLAVVFHPPIDMSQASDLREFPGTWRKPLPYMARNRAIVDECELLIAMPGMSDEERLRSGTWATVRYARRMRRPVVRLLRMGGWQEEEGRGR